MPRSKSPKRRRSSRSTGPSPVPAGYPTVIPYLAVQEGTAALEFYRSAFGARVLQRNTTPDGKLIHGRIRLGNSVIMLSDVFPGADVASPATVGTTTVTLHLYTKDVDRVWDRAVAAGAKVTMPLDNQYWGERYGHLLDPFGHHWSLSMRVRMSKAEKDAKRADAEAAFSRGEHPGQAPEYGDA
jgi:PhnB protein